jgi:Tfp pilus assembly protein PilW
MTRTHAGHESPRRRGATLMEYLMMISLIITVALVAIGYFGAQTNVMTGASSSAIQTSLKK